MKLPLLLFLIIISVGVNWNWYFFIAWAGCVMGAWVCFSIALLGGIVVVLDWVFNGRVPE